MYTYMFLYTNLWDPLVSLFLDYGGASLFLALVVLGLAMVPGLVAAWGHSTPLQILRFGWWQKVEKSCRTPRQRTSRDFSIDGSRGETEFHASAIQLPKQCTISIYIIFCGLTAHASAECPVYSVVRLNALHAGSNFTLSRPYWNCGSKACSKWVVSARFLSAVPTSSHYICTYPLVNIQKNYGKSPFSMGKSTINHHFQ